jgi:hypothetical protein
MDGSFQVDAVDWNYSHILNARATGKDLQDG